VALQAVAALHRAKASHKAIVTIAHPSQSAVFEHAPWNEDRAERSWRPVPTINITFVAFRSRNLCWLSPVPSGLPEPLRGLLIGLDR
jgi:hypothetical protein